MAAACSTPPTYDKYDYRQDLCDVVLSLVRSVVEFLRAHPDAVGVLVRAWLELQRELAAGGEARRQMGFRL